MITYDKELNLQQVNDLLYGNETLTIAQEAMDRMADCYQFLQSFSKGKVIYGINTGFGPMAQYRVNDDSLLQLQYNIIRSHAIGAGQPLSDLQVKAAMIVRLGTLLQGYSGVHPSAAQLLLAFINKGIYPKIPQHGSVGASGDLVQLAHMALALIGEGEVHYHGTWQPTAQVLQQECLEPLQMYLREGLCLTNGTSVMTGLGLINILQARQLLDWSVLSSAWMNEIAASYDDFMAPALNTARRHPGQRLIAEAMRHALDGSTCVRSRQNTLYNSGQNNETYFTHKVQPFYSLRCVPQILGPIYETLQRATAVTVDELNSASDNPIVDPATQNVYHGGNFHGDYVSLEMDKVKIVVTRLTMLAERQMSYLFHDKINEMLPAFLNMGVPGLNYGMQAAQFTATSTTAECQTLSMPNYVHSIPNNNDNQDIVSMGTNSALLTQRVIDNSFQVMAIHFMALAQAVDCLKIEAKLAPATRKVYHQIRAIQPVWIQDTPRYQDIERIITYLKDTPVSL